MEFYDLFSVSNWILYTIAALSLWYLYATKNYNYWKVRGLPEVKPFPIIGSFGQMALKVFHLEENKCYKKLGRVYGTFEGSKPVISIGDPDLLRNIFVKDFNHFVDRRDMQTGDVIGDNFVFSLKGEQWKHVRTLMTPAYTTGKLKRVISVIKDCSQTLKQNLMKAVKENKPINCKELFGTFSMDVICTSAFATKIDSYNDPNNPIVSTAKKLFTGNVSWRIVVWYLFPWFMKLFKLSILEPEVTYYYKDIVLRIMEQRKKTGKAPNDFFQLMLDMTKGSTKSDDEKALGEEDELEQGNSQLFSKATINKGFTNDELVAQAIIFFIAGYDTTALALSFLAYNLALNPDVQERLSEELDEAFDDVKDLNYEKLCELKYLDKVVSESMRICPLAARIERLCTEDYKLGDTGITIPKGMMVAIPTYAIHHDPEFYPDPEKFDPERFSPADKANRHPFTYLPFGAGPRNCIGKRFALFEIKLCTSIIWKQFKFSACPQTQVPLEFYKGNNQMQPKGVYLNVEVRKDIKLNSIMIGSKGQI